MKTLAKLFENNKQWSERIQKDNPDFFTKLSQQQTPEYLWIGCADSRVPANQIIDVLPGEVFVHRNIANVVTNTDINCLSVIQYAVEVLKVRHIIVCGHYGCGGVMGAMGNDSLGLIDNWLRHIKDVIDRADVPSDLSDKERANLMCELNVAAQVRNVCHTTIVQEAWKRGQELDVHGWIYSLKDGRLKDLDLCINSPEQLPDVYRLRFG